MQYTHCYKIVSFCIVQLLIIVFNHANIKEFMNYLFKQINMNILLEILQIYITYTLNTAYDK